MTITATSRLSIPTIGPARLRAILGNRFVGVGAAAVLLAAAVTGLVTIVGPMSAGIGHARVSLAHAPKPWRAALRQVRGPLVITEDVVRLSERPLAVQIGAAWNRPSGPQAAPLTPGGPLPPAPIAGFSAPGPAGPLPVIGTDGRTPFQAYRRPFLPNGRPRVALTLGGLGLDAKVTQIAIDTLPPEITLAFSAYAEDLQGWIDKARARGHEVLLEAPMEPLDYPDNDPGPYTLMSRAPPLETTKKLEWILSRAAGYMGVTNNLGARFLAENSAYGAFATVMHGRGIAFVDDGGASGRRDVGVIRASAERIVDDQPNMDAIDQQLLALESSALQRGQALGAARAYPVTLETLARWSRSLESRGFQLAPVSALAH